MIRQAPARLLVVDDDEIVLAGLGAALQQAGFEVAVCRSGDAALDEVLRGEFEVVITDVMMPGLSGIGLLERVRSRAPGVRVIVLSGYPRKGLAEEALRKGADDFLVKPVAQSRLCGAVESLLAQGGTP